MDPVRYSCVCCTLFTLFVNLEDIAEVLDGSAANGGLTSFFSLVRTIFSRACRLLRCFCFSTSDDDAPASLFSFAVRVNTCCRYVVAIFSILCVASDASGLPVFTDSWTAVADLPCVATRSRSPTDLELLDCGCYAPRY